MSQSQKDYVIACHRALRAWAEKNVPARLIHQPAAATVSDKIRLPEVEQQAGRRK